MPRHTPTAGCEVSAFGDRHFCHGAKEYVRGDITTNTVVDGYNSIFKRGMKVQGKALVNLTKRDLSRPAKALPALAGEALPTEKAKP
jgi:hypothetical protein